MPAPANILKAKCKSICSKGPTSKRRATCRLRSKTTKNAVRKRSPAGGPITVRRYGLMPALQPDQAFLCVRLHVFFNVFFATGHTLSVLDAGMAHICATHKKNDTLGHVFGVIANTLKGAGNEDQVNRI